MPRELRDLKEFLATCSRKDARCVKIKKNPSATKFKVRTSRFLFSLVVTDKKKADRITKSIHPNVRKVLISGKKERRAAKKQAKA